MQRSTVFDAATYFDYTDASSSSLFENQPAHKSNTAATTAHGKEAPKNLTQMCFHIKSLTHTRPSRQLNFSLIQPPLLREVELEPQSGLTVVKLKAGTVYPQTAALAKHTGERGRRWYCNKVS